MRLPVSETLAWPDALLAGGSEMGRRIHAFDWSRTPLGPIDRWTRSLRAYVGMIVDNPFPMYVFWGEHDVVIYNDASIAFTGNKHPAFFGRTSADFWAEIWPVIDPLLRTVKAGEPVTHVDLKLSLERHGFLEDAYFTFSYSPLRDEDGAIAGVLATVFETT